MLENSEERMITKALEGRERTELFYGTSRQMSVRAFGGEIAAFSVAETAGVGSRVIRENRTGAAYSERVSSEEIARIIDMAETNSAFPESDEGNVLLEEGSVESFDAREDDLSEVSVEKKRTFALGLESVARGLDKRIVNVPYASYGESTGSSILGNSFGVLKSYTYGYCYAFIQVMANKNDDVQVGSHVAAAASYDEIDETEIAKRAVEKAIARLGAVEPESGTYTVVFDQDAASDLLGAFISGGGSPFFGENIQKGRSRLEGKRGTEIGSPFFTLVDEPMGGIAPSPFDSEGVVTSKLAFVDSGIFRSVIHNLYSATRGSAKSTGHGSRGGYRGGISTSLHNPYLPNGEVTPDELIAQTDSGIFVTDVEGLHAGLNPISGDFSLSAKGFLIEGGATGGALKNMVVAGNFFELATRLSGAANDRIVKTHKSFSAPSIRIDDLSVSSN